MGRLKGTRKEDWRCDCCKKWVKVPTDLYAPLDGFEQYAVCNACLKKNSEDYWVVWCHERKNEV